MGVLLIEEVLHEVCTLERSPFRHPSGTAALCSAKGLLTRCIYYTCMQTSSFSTASIHTGGYSCQWVMLFGMSFNQPVEMGPA